MIEDDQRIRVIAKDLDEETRNYIKDVLSSYAGEYDLRFGLKTLKEYKIYVKETHIEGSKKDYEMKAHLICDFGDFHVVKKGWKPKRVFDEVMDALKAQVKHKLKLKSK
ncbi:MAG: hypothetical protein GF334_11250 [Candidatus Altiarchaeales archaeon]|nr:hypothetical protein [Candidatus Altiarchaeales archaeon]